jgi:hypothetical protein
MQFLQKIFVDVRFQVFFQIAFRIKNRKMVDSMIWFDFLLRHGVSPFSGRVRETVFPLLARSDGMVIRQPDTFNTVKDVSCLELLCSGSAEEAASAHLAELRILLTA